MLLRRTEQEDIPRAFLVDDLRSNVGRGAADGVERLRYPLYTGVIMRSGAVQELYRSPEKSRSASGQSMAYFLTEKKRERRGEKSKEGKSKATEKARM